MRRSQIEQIVKLFKFKKRAKDDYCLELPKTRIFLYYYRDTPKGWQVHIISNGRSTIRQINSAYDLLASLQEVTITATLYNERIRIEGALTDKVREVVYGGK